MQFKTAAAVEQQRAQSQHQMLESRCVEDVYNAYPTLVRCTATSKMILESVYEFVGRTDVVPTLDLRAARGDSGGLYERDLITCGLPTNPGT